MVKHGIWTNVWHLDIAPGAFKIQNMIDITEWLGELPLFEDLPLKTQLKIVRTIEHMLKNPASTLPYFKKILGMSPNNKQIKNPELWPSMNMIVANVSQYKPSKHEIVEGGFRGINTNKFAIYLTTKTRFKPQVFEKFKTSEMKLESYHKARTHQESITELILIKSELIEVFEARLNKLRERLVRSGQFNDLELKIHKSISDYFDDLIAKEKAEFDKI